MSIVCKEFPNKVFSNKVEMFKALIEFKPQLTSLKKSITKFTDGVEFGLLHDITDKMEAVKANEPVLDANVTEVKVKVVMNTTNLLDSHGDVHIKDIWKRTLSHSSTKLHLQEHKRQFDAVISNDAKAYTKTASWKSLGYEFEGNTQALIFESLVKQSRNPMMFEQYKNGWVNNHSVGMQYVDLDICINSEERWASEYKDNWEKYISDIANKEDAEAIGYFWAVKEAKLIEGSAVLFGSNWATPTLDNNMKTAAAPSEEVETDKTTHKPSYYSGLI